MKTIELSSWPRKTHFNFFRSFQHPHIAVCTHVDAATYCRSVRDEGISLFLALTFAATRAANAVPEFRTRMRFTADGTATVVEHELVHPTVTVPITGNRFNFCMLEYASKFSHFSALAQPRLQTAQAQDGLFDDSAGRDDVVYMTSAPWVSFTSATLPLYGPEDCVPRVVWGKLGRPGAAHALPILLMVHHALADAWHLSQFLERFQEILSAPLHRLDEEATNGAGGGESR